MFVVLQKDLGSHSVGNFIKTQTLPF